MIDDAFRIFIGCYLFACGFCFPLVVLCLAWAPTVDDDADNHSYYGHEFSLVDQGDRRQGSQKDDEHGRSRERLHDAGTDAFFDHWEIG